MRKVGHFGSFPSVDSLRDFKVLIFGRFIKVYILSQLIIESSINFSNNHISDNYICKESLIIEKQIIKQQYLLQHFSLSKFIQIILAYPESTKFYYYFEAIVDSGKALIYLSLLYFEAR